MRGCFAFETSDRFDVDACIRENVTFGKQNQTAFARGMFWPPRVDVAIRSDA
ncbi:MAG: hypothetical protein MZU97_20660 [Bacillus subtilis]|nr:hypothetical protein [Bacillus subtilis]